MALYDTVANIVSKAAIELGLGEVPNVFAAKNPAHIQLRQLLETLGQELVLGQPWIQCVKEHTFATDAATSYALPADYLSMVDGTGWNRTQMRELLPCTPQAWQYSKARNTGSVFNVLFRARHLTLEIPTEHTAGDTIAFEYRSRYWVALTGTTTPTLDAPAANDNVICFDRLLMIRGLKLKFRRAKRMDSSAEQLEFDETFGQLKSLNVGAAPVLSLDGAATEERFLDESNAPSTGFGFDGMGGLY